MNCLPTSGRVLVKASELHSLTGGRTTNYAPCTTQKHTRYVCMLRRPSISCAVSQTSTFLSTFSVAQRRRSRRRVGSFLQDRCAIIYKQQWFRRIYIYMTKERVPREKTDRFASARTRWAFLTLQPHSFQTKLSAQSCVVRAGFA